MISTFGTWRFHHRIRQHPSLHGFTLIELLVVIAIISLLVSILIPSLVKAKKLAIDVLCINNVRQIALAMHLYESDSQRLQYARGLPDPDPKEIGQGTKLGLDEGLNPYVQNMEIFRCPNDIGFDMTAGNTPCGNNSYWNDWGTSYYYNGLGIDRSYDDWDDHSFPQFGYYTTYPKAPNDGYLEKVLAQPSAKILVTEQYFVWANFKYPPIPISWHSEDSFLTSVGFLDGHGDMVDMDRYDPDRSPSNPFDALDGSYHW